MSDQEKAAAEGESPAEIDVHPTRAKMLALLGTNPNYFGTLPGVGYEPVEKLAADTTYEALSCVSYSPERDRLEATIEIRRPTGYSGPLCSAGSFEYVRFWVDYGAGWEDAGVSVVNVHDIPAGTDCAGRRWHPLSYVVGVDHQPKRRWCGSPVLPKVRAILSWGVQPPSTPPPASPADWLPVWGDVKECRVQIRPRTFWFTDIGDLVDSSILDKVIAQLPPHLKAIPAPTGPEAHLPAALPLPELAELSRRADVPEHRFMVPHLAQQKVLAAPTPEAFLGSANLLSGLKIDLSAILDLLDDGKGDTTYEQLMCLGLDDTASALVASFVVKQQSGYSGGPCTKGSTEYVAFWADWDDECKPQYLGTVEVPVHDYEDSRDELCYAAVLPVDLGALRRPCDQARLSRVRAVLSWGTPPSTTDPDAVPYWGNRIDRHVQVAPGVPYDGTARFTRVGGVPSDNVSQVTGLTGIGSAGTLPVVVANVARPVAVGAPFAGWVHLQGPLDPSLAGRTYRLRAVSASGSEQVFTTGFHRVTPGGSLVPITPGADGSLVYPGSAQFDAGELGRFAPGGDERWTVYLEFWVGGAWVAEAQATVQMDNTVEHVALELETAAACKMPAGPVEGTLTASDLNFRSWSIQVLGSNDWTVTPVDPVSGVPLSTTVPAPPPGRAFRIDFTGAPPCGYVVRLWMHEDVVVSSTYPVRSSNDDQGLCLT